VAAEVCGTSSRRLDAGGAYRHAERGTGPDGVHRFASTEPISDWLCPLRKRAAQFACLEPNELVQALLIRYDPGAGIGWHRDRPVFERMVLAPGNPPAKHAAATVPMPTWPATLTAEHHRITQHAPEYGIHQRIADEAWVFLSP
jgi:hypothetical protein